ncbi:hypothetical protein VP01_929g1 [Puccinia sorghi]|uniref:Uncharacterized protein n=1 Tax=Puccinia sorghi TaxID=27349 RepID=A0A0L6U718_9BASI|nr:hypothetical protein VP01_929g1 [Puccinia sorghi]
MSPDKANIYAQPCSHCSGCSKRSLKTPRLNHTPLEPFQQLRYPKCLHFHLKLCFQTEDEGSYKKLYRISSNTFVGAAILSKEAAYQSFAISMNNNSPGGSTLTEKNCEPNWKHISRMYLKKRSGQRKLEQVWTMMIPNSASKKLELMCPHYTQILTLFGPKNNTNSLTTSIRLKEYKKWFLQAQIIMKIPCNQMIKLKDRKFDLILLIFKRFFVWTGGERFQNGGCESHQAKKKATCTHCHIMYKGAPVNNFLVISIPSNGHQVTPTRATWEQHQIPLRGLEPEILNKANPLTDFLIKEIIILCERKKNMIKKFSKTMPSLSGKKIRGLGSRPP